MFSKVSNFKPVSLVRSLGSSHGLGRLFKDKLAQTDVPVTGFSERPFDLREATTTWRRGAQLVVGPIAQEEKPFSPRKHRYYSMDELGVFKRRPNDSVKFQGGWTKHKAPQKRAKHLLSVLSQEAQIEAKTCLPNLIPEFKPGDALELKVKPFATSSKITTYKGVVIGIRRRSINTTFHLASVSEGKTVYQVFPLYDPLIEEINVLKKAFIHSMDRPGKEVVRNKLYYLLRDPKLQKRFRITDKSDANSAKKIVKMQIRAMEGGRKKGGKKHDKKRRAKVRELKRKVLEEASAAAGSKKEAS